MKGDVGIDSIEEEGRVGKEGAVGEMDSTIEVQEG